MTPNHAPASAEDATPRMPAPEDGTTTLPVAPPDGASLRAGDRLGRYRLDDRLGAGGMGVVWKAWDLQLERAVALKVLRTGGDVSAPVVARFLREARLAAALRHPHLARVHDVGEEAGRVFLIMDLIDGTPLSDWLDDAESGAGIASDPARLRQGLEFLAQAAEAVSFAHARSVIHRDLKPGNILVTRAQPPSVRVVDFGLAKEFRREAADRPAGATLSLLTAAGQALGTPDYMSPEQARGEGSEVGPRSDVWSLGALLYEVLAGRTPFRRDSVWETMEAVVGAEVVPPGRIRPGVPPALEAVCLRALEKDPERRTASAADFAADLRAWLRGDPVRARPPGRLERLSRALSRRRGVLAAALAAAVLLVAALTWAGHVRRVDAARKRALVDEVSVAILRFEDSVQRTELPPEARASLAAQPLDLLERAVRDDPGYGLARSWRGVVLALLGRTAEADADLDAGCALSPGDPRVWRLRGMHRLDRAGRSAPVPLAAPSLTAGVEVLPPAEPSEEVREWLAGGLADLANMERAAGEPEAAGAPEVEVARAAALLHSGRPGAPDEALRRLADLPGPRASSLRGMCRYIRSDFLAARTEYEHALAEWPQDRVTRRRYVHVLRAIGLVLEAKGDDPRAAFQQALVEAETLAGRDPNSPASWFELGGARFELALALGRRGGDSRTLLEASVKAYTEGLALQNDAATLQSRGTAWVYLAQAREGRGESAGDGWERALADHSDAVRMEPQRADVRLNRAAGLVELAKSEARRGLGGLPHFREAVLEFDRALVVDPDYVPAYLGRALAWMTLGEAESTAGLDPGEAFDRALADLDEVDRRSPGIIITWIHRGNAWHRKGKSLSSRRGDPRPHYRGAIEAFSEAVRRQPASPEAVSGLAFARLSLAMAEENRGTESRALFERAVADLDQAILLNPASALTWVNRGKAKRQLAQLEVAAGHDPEQAYAPAVADLEEAIRLNPRYGEAHQLASDMLHDLGHAREAMRDDPRSWFVRALACLDAALECVPDSVEYLGKIGHLRTCLAQARLDRAEDPRDDLARALEALDAVLRARPGNGLAHFDRGRARRLQAQVEAARGGDPDPRFAEAEQDLRAATEHGFPSALLELAWIQRTTGRWKDMLATSERAVQEVTDARTEARERRVEAQRFVQLDASPHRWLAVASRGHQRMHALHYSAALDHLEAGLRALDELLRGWEPDRRTRFQEDPVVRSMRASSHVAVARIRSLLSIGKAGPLADPVPIGPAECEAHRDAAFAALRAAVDLGFRAPDELRRQADLAPLAEDARWRDLLERIR